MKAKAHNTGKVKIDSITFNGINAVYNPSLAYAMVYSYTNHYSDIIFFMKPEQLN